MRRIPAFFLAILSVLALMSGTARAAGDNAIASSSPAAGEVVNLAPTQLQLQFTNPIGGDAAIAAMGLVLTCEGKITNLGPPQLGADGTTVSAALTQTLGNGTCTVTWSLPDGSTGSFTFTSNTQPTTTLTNNSVPTTEATIPGLPGSEVKETGPRLGGAIGLLRWLSFLFVAMFFGGLIFIRYLWPEGVEYGIAETYIRQVGIAAAVCLVFLATVMTAQHTGGGILGSLSPTSWGAILGDKAGSAVIFRLGAVLGLLYLSWITEQIFDDSRSSIVVPLLAVLMITYGFDRFSGRVVVLGAVIAVLHMAFVSLWVGSGAIIWRVILHGPGDVDLLHALRQWTRYNGFVTTGIVVTGFIQVYRVDGISLINSGHGRIVLIKALMTGALIFVNSGIRLFIRQGLRRANSLNARAVYRLKRPVGVELSLSVVVLALSSWMMSMRPPYVLLHDKTDGVEYAIVQDMKGADEFHVRLSLSPGNVGPNRVLVELFGPKRIQNFTVDFVPSNPNFSGYTLHVPLTRPGAALLQEVPGMKFMAAGLWTATIRGITTIGNIGPLSTTFVIADGTSVTTLPRQGLTPVTTTIAPAATPAPTAAPNVAPATIAPTLAPAVAPTVAPTVAPQG
jgi:putative copper export protein/methionine-rich copper-binding protein CopC